MIRNILFDLGGILYHIDYQATVEAFNQLGHKEFEKVFHQHQQSPLFDLFETGKISQNCFFDKLGKLFKGVDQNQLIRAWNKMLIGMPKENLDLLTDLSKDYNLFLLSNANETHIEYVEKDLKHTLGIEKIDPFFKKAYFSHKIGLRKPCIETFRWIINDAGINASETVFIEDTKQHIDGAQAAGLHTLHIKTNKDLSRPFLDKALSELH